ncbi:hypothetical protein ACJ4V0_18450 [Phreatobacter sp. HK31-P]
MSDDAPPDTVRISSTEYATFMREREELHRLRALLSDGVQNERSRHFGDSDVAAFFAEQLRLSATIQEAQAAAADRFGPRQIPSSSAVHRYWTKLRKLAAHGLSAVPPRRPSIAYSVKVRPILDECYDAGLAIDATVAETKRRVLGATPTREAVAQFFLDRRLADAKRALASE